MIGCLFPSLPLLSCICRRSEPLSAMSCCTSGLYTPSESLLHINASHALRRYTEGGGIFMADAVMNATPHYHFLVLLMLMLLLPLMLFPLVPIHPHFGAL